MAWTKASRTSHLSLGTLLGGLGRRLSTCSIARFKLSHKDQSGNSDFIEVAACVIVRGIGLILLCKRSLDSTSDKFS